MAYTWASDASACYLKDNLYNRTATAGRVSGTTAKRTAATRACLPPHDAYDFLQWASTDDRVAAVMPWKWDGCVACNGSRWTPPETCCMDEIGARDMPEVRAAWADVGKQLLGRA